jgi:hypothetical protein
MNICVATRSFLLMRRVGMILRLEMFGLMLATFANPDHHFSMSKTILDQNMTSIVSGSH